jgi:hypothetical protein
MLMKNIENALKAAKRTYANLKQKNNDQREEEEHVNRGIASVVQWIQC